MNILAFDTSSKTASVAILQDEAVLYDRVIDTGRKHSEVLLPAIDEACRQIGVKISAIDLFSCTLGPGSFTGLRIGLSTLSGLMMATQKPAAGISALEALAMNAPETDRIIGAMMDAGRGQVYLAYYHRESAGRLRALGAQRAVAPQNIPLPDDQDILFVGDGAILYADVLRNLAPGKIGVAPAECQHIRASFVGLLAKEKYRMGELLTPASCIPVYLRSADAELPKPVF